MDDLIIIVKLLRRVFCVFDDRHTYNKDNLYLYYRIYLLIITANTFTIQLLHQILCFDKKVQKKAKKAIMVMQYDELRRGSLDLFLLSAS